MCECEAGCQLGWVLSSLAPEPPWLSGWGCGCQLAWEEAAWGGSGVSRVLFSTSWRKEDEVWWAPREIGGDLGETFF